MRAPRLFLGAFVLALLMPLLLPACGGSVQPTDGPSSGRATAALETPASPAPTPSTLGSGDAPNATDAPEPAAATALPAASGSAGTDREALVALYNATDGENWFRSVNWLSDAPIGEWWGVTTDDEGRVTALVLRENGVICFWSDGTRSSGEFEVITRNDFRAILHKKPG